MEKSDLSKGPMICEPMDRRDTAQYVQHGQRRAVAGKLWLAASTLVAGWHLHRFACKPSMHMPPQSPIPHTDNIEWSSCGDNYECGHADLAVGRYLAKNKTSRLGSLFINPGGPGGSGMSFLYRAGPALATICAESFKQTISYLGTLVASMEQRELWVFLPNEKAPTHSIAVISPGVDCFASQTDQDIAFSHTYQDVGFEARNLSDPVDRAVYAQQVRKADAENAVIAQLCLNRTGEGLRHVGTATVVRDLELLSRVIEGPEKMAFWHEVLNFISRVVSPRSGLDNIFLTLSPQRYFVNMFPERVGNVTIDGVVDPILWATTGAYEWGKWDLVDTERAYTNFLDACAEVSAGLDRSISVLIMNKAGPERCALNTNERSTAQAIRKAVEKFIDDLYERPLPVPHGEQPYILTSDLLFINMYRPRGWPALAEQIAAGINGDGAPITNAVLNTIERNSTKKAQTAMAIEAVTCVDGPELYDVDPHKAVEAIIEENVQTYGQVSTHFAGVEVSIIYPCHPVAEPITPVVNARTVNRLLPQSRLIVQDGSGHCSLAMASTCTAKAIRGYFLDGVLPPNGIVCDTIERLFPEKSAPAEAKAWLNSEASFSEADTRLAEVVRDLGMAMEPFVGLHKKPKSLL
ncbi:TAP-like domain-containing protein [Rhizoctonia solani AG-1 IA]|uniref:TAP-like domain-containing protein n=1 Tax=Thanatephorus cucumeris (strain AG1-IA) TaxID=983506 RepID=L8WZV6_THACA|nr:TAP-like domain-containing protein [Rhizoctonia solani AG-1 IA]